MRSIFYLIYVVILLLMAACSDDGVIYSPPDNTVKLDSMSCKISGDLTVDFRTNTVNREVFPKEDTGKIAVSGTIAANSINLYAVVIAFKYTEQTTGEYDLSTSDWLTRVEKMLGPTSVKESYRSDVTGKVHITVFNDSEIAGTFSFSAKTADKSKSINVENGIFSFKKSK